MTETPKVIVNCKSCGDVIDVSKDPDEWPLQCPRCMDDDVPLPAGYEDLVGGPHDHRKKTKKKTKEK